ncbi:thioredoxin domain-containing protein [Pontimonas salivibrio]|uniref:Thioredoxin domain-containing protein n=1 Tax=Pontimonas salivibrio TaxID=1159327 RepID=A0A2L2BRV4_9MICO|nr:thioredoxin family protein [Pontimonas salivibrio]AVG24342.1 thioredoxin domain-containing protein [Pontimonas salivibrio]
MDSTLSMLLIIGLVVLASAVGVIWRATRSRVSAPGSSETSPRVPSGYLAVGKTLTMLQVSAPLCSYCGAMRGILAAAAERDPQVGHVEYDVSEIPDVIESFTIRRTPTTLLVSASGDVLFTLEGPTPPGVVSDHIHRAYEEIQRRSDEYLI